MKHLSRKHQLLVSLCCISLTVCLWLGNVTSSIIQIQIGKATNAQNTTSSQWVQEGVKKYQADQYLDAIEDWNKALDIEKNNSNPRNKAIISENLARAYQQVGQTENAIKHWEQVVQLQTKLRDVTKLGRALTELAQVYSSYGQPKKAIELLCGRDNTDNATTNTTNKTDNTFNIDKCRTSSALQIAKQSNDFEGQVAALGSLGEAYRLFEGCEDDNCKAITILNQFKKDDNNINKDKVQNKNYQIAILNSLANIYINRASLNYRRAFSLKNQGDYNADDKKKEAEQDDERGLKELEKSLVVVRETGNKLTELQILLNKLFIYKRTKPSENVDKLWNNAREISKALPKNSQTAYAYIDLADKLQPTVDVNSLPISLSQCSQELKNSPRDFDEAQKLLNEAASIARQVKDNRAESFALGKLGKLYECSSKSDKYDIALAYTKQAREVIETNLAAQDSLFLWEWQAGRILKKQGKIADAIIAYKNSKHSLEQVRQKILSDNRNFQFDFRDEVEPIYRELIALQLNAKAGSKDNKLNQSHNHDLLGALETMDSLKIGELQNYFGNDCIINIPEQNSNNQFANLGNKNKFKDKIVSLIDGDKQTAIINSIIFDDKTAIILTLYNRKSEIVQKIEWINENKESLRNEIISYYSEIQDKESGQDYIHPAKKLYEKIIQPFEKETYFKQNQIKTIIFVQDGLFQSIPMASLFDGKKFLVEKYAIATVPSLSLIDNKKFDKSNLQVLALGLAEQRTIDGKEFKQLKNVEPEIKSIINKTILLNKNFNRKNLKKELSKQIYSVIHMATHGKAGIESKNTFILTGEREPGKEKLTITELDGIIRSQTKKQNRIDLLAITACESAVGDDRSSLGLAGIAIQAGARSTLASLWLIDDAATAELTKVFYESLSKSGLTKAQALQEAQNKLRETEEKRHPYYWAPFILVGNWQ